MTIKPVIPATALNVSPANYEDSHVHSVYDSIAHHFSSTRYKPWPVVAAFLSSISPGYIGLDAGCGNGKYLIAPSDKEGTYWTIGLDRSIRLLDVAKRAGNRDRECVLSDVLDCPWRTGAFDFAISIATIHHLSTPERRKKSVQSLLRCLSPTHGRGLVYVWAVKQDEKSKRSVPILKEGTDKNCKGVDVFVPWVLTEDPASGKRDTTSAELKPESLLDNVEHASRGNRTPAFNRYYHMFEEGELRQLLITAGNELGISLHSSKPEPQSLCDSSDSSDSSRRSFIEIVRDDWERSNYFVEFRLYQK